MRQMQIFAFFQVIVLCRGLAAILVMSDRHGVGDGANPINGHH